MSKSDSRDAAKSIEVDPRISGYIKQVAGRFRRVRLLSWLGLVWGATALLAAVLWWLQVDGYFFIARAAWLLVPLSIATAVVAAVAAWSSFRNTQWLAERVEREYPELQQRLLTAVSLRPQTSDARLSYLQRSVVDETVRHGYVHRWTTIVPARRLALAHVFHLCALLLAVLAVFQLARSEPSEALLAAAAKQENALAGGNFEVAVDPGHTEIEKGTSLIVAARFGISVPRGASLVWTDKTGNEQRVAMTRNLEDPLFAARVAEVTSELTYHVEFSNKQTEDFRVTVFEYPRLLRSDAKLVFPGYTQLAEKTIEDTRRVSAVEGATLTWLCHLNKPVATAQLVDEDGGTVELTADDSNPQLYAASLRLRESRTWKLQLTDEAGRQNKFPPELSVQVLPNQPPELKLATGGDARVSPLEEFPVEGSYWDDYGLRRFGLTYSLGGEAPQDVVLGEGGVNVQEGEVVHLVDFEAMQAEPDNLLSYHLWAEDVGPDGEPRRVFSDMYFAEVRHFEEIFREGQPPPGGQQPQGGQSPQMAGELADLQKEIINGTWNVIRRETDSEPSDKFAGDVALLRESQATAVDQLEKLAQRVSDPQSRQYVESVRGHMSEAIRHYTKALDGDSIDELTPALTAGQASYQALLKLRAREHQVVRSQQGGGGGGGSQQRLQDQLSELELSNEQSRYETQSRATEQADQQQREVQQALSRLKELARRQKDLNEQMKKLQTALEQAATEKEREEIERQLKRLREQQEQMLRDTDELLDRMDRPENRRQMSEQRQQLEETRENLRQSSEALEQNDVSQSLSSGTRAERQFEQLRDEFRNQTANQFSEEMREMQQQARDLEGQQQKLSQDLAELGDQRQLRLGDRGQRDRLGEDIESQREDLDALLERMRETVEQAENVEPLLAQKLYDSYREARQRRVDENLEGMSQLLRRGLDPQVSEVEEKVGEAITELREDIEQAAESVLGDQVETLRRAVAELDELTRQLNDEIQRANPGQVRPGDENGDTQTPSDQQQPGDQQQRDDSESPQQSGQPGENPDSPPGNQPAENSAQQGQPSADQQSEQSQRSPSGNPSESQPSQGQPSQGQPNQGQPNQGQPGRGGSRNQWSNGGGSFRDLATDSQRVAPLTGGDFLQWSDRLRDVEQMLDDRDLSGEAARIRDRAREFRRDIKRQARDPQWDLVQEMVAEPLEELKQRVSEELLRRSAERNELVPIDRDPVPERFADRVQRYYEQLGAGK